MNQLIRFLTISLLASSPVWACALEGCMMKDMPALPSSDAGLSSLTQANRSFNSSGGGSSSYSYDNNAIPGNAPQAAMPQARKAKKGEKPVDLDAIAAGSPEARGIIAKKSRLSPGGSPAAREAENNLASGSVSSDGVTRVRGARSLASTGRTRTIAGWDSNN